MEVKSIGKRIKLRREELKMSQDELAQKLGYKSRSSVNKIELDVRNLTQSKIKAIADALETTPAYIMGWEEPTHLGKPEADIDAAIIKEATELSNIYMHLNEEDRADLLKFARRLAR